MDNKLTKRILSVLLTLAMVIGMIPASVLTVRAGHTCGECNEWIDGSPYCSECYACDQCIELCLECGKCTDCTGASICDGCSDAENGSMCTDCSEEKGAHCPECDACYFTTLWCDECGQCESCCPICEKCSEEMGYGVICMDCAEGHGSHCPGCGECYFEAGGWCEDCMLCAECMPLDTGCSEIHGATLCGECSADRGSHCPECSQCYFEVGSWCEECGKCEDCSPACIYCCEEAGAVICEECAIEQGMHCPECSDCYAGGEYCTECGVCTACAEYCATDELCLDCAIAGGYHCPGCEICADGAVLCEGCGEKCVDCADAFCENCNLCSDCVLICQGCNSCEECAAICPNCEEYCSECEGICDDCELCLVCCADLAGFAGCDCSDWVCVESGDWDAHFDAEHSGAGQTSHTVRPYPTWSWDATYHWHSCVYCEDAGHQTGKAKHSYDANGKCTVCYFVKDAKIQIIVQPRDSKTALVHCNDEVYDESNIARFNVVAIGNSALTYTWCLRTYVQGVLTYEPLRSPGSLEDYEGTEIAVLVPEDACWHEYYICCFITDEAGNEVKTADVLLGARHDYHYYKLWKSHQRPCEFAQRSQYGHVLQCVGTECEKVTHLRPHQDEDRNGSCDICDYEIGAILITKQPKNTQKVYSYNPDEGYDESNIAHFSVVAEGESALTYTWCRKQYVNGKLTYVPLKNPGKLENYDGPELDLLVPEDACCVEYTYACIITDAEGNETRTVDVTLNAKHNYQYYADYLTDRSDPYGEARRKYHAHKLVCVSPACGKVTRMRQHVDENKDYFCDICNSKKDIMNVGITVTAPKEGQLPNYNVTADSVAYFAMGGSSNYTQYRFWFVSDNGVDNWRLIDKTTPFEAGKYYKFVVEMQTKSAYQFPQMVSYGGEPYFWATVNGNFVKAHETYNMDPAHYVTISYEFGMCNDSVIESIVIDNVTEPVAGEKPTYTATIRGSGYYIDTDMNKSYDAYWAKPAAKWPYIKNGIGWYDWTKNDWVYDHETFIPGHEYQIRIYLKTEDGYTFYHDKLEMLFTASVNGNAATGNTTTSGGLIEQTISASFPCKGKEITTVMVNSLDTPKAGETPDYSPRVAYPEWYQLDPNYGGTGGVIWFDSEGNQMDPTDTFVEGEKYKVEIKLIPAQLNGADTCQFVSPVSAYINGKQVVAQGDWDNVYANAKAVYIYYTFTKGASAAPTDGKKGDVDSSGAVDVDDAIYLLQYVLMPDLFPVSRLVDFDGNGAVDVDDAIYLLQHVLMPDLFPI